MGRGISPCPKMIIKLLFNKTFFCADLDGKSEEVDEACAVVLIVNLVLVEGRDFFIVERIGACNACVDDVALVEL